MPAAFLPSAPTVQRITWQARSLASLDGKFCRGDFTMAQQAKDQKSTKQQPAGKGKPAPKKGK